MGRSYPQLRRLASNLRPFLVPGLVCFFLFLCASAAFAWQRRNDLLILASGQSRVFWVKRLVAWGADASAPTDIFFEPALVHYLNSIHVNPTAPQNGDLAEALVRAGGSVSDRNAHGWTPLMLAAASGQLEIAKVLLRHGADIDARATANLEHAEGMTALMLASMRGHSETVRYLTDRGANIHLRSREGFTALLVAASRGHFPCVQILVLKGASIPLSTIQVAQRNGYMAVAEFLRGAMGQSRAELLTRRPARTPEE